MKKMDLASVPVETGSNYPYPFNLPCSAQSCQRLARHGGLSLFGVNLTVIELRGVPRSDPVETGSNYPYPFNLPCSAQSCQRLARHGGLSLFGVNLTVIELRGVP